MISTRTCLPVQKPGFDEFQGIYKKTAPYTYLDSPEALSEDAILLDDLYSDSDEIGYIFIVDKEIVTINLSKNLR